MRPLFLRVDLEVVEDQDHLLDHHIEVVALIVVMGLTLSEVTTTITMDITHTTMLAASLTALFAVITEYVLLIPKLARNCRAKCQSISSYLWCSSAVASAAFKLRPKRDKKYTRTLTLGKIKKKTNFLKLTIKR